MSETEETVVFPPYRRRKFKSDEERKEAYSQQSKESYQRHCETRKARARNYYHAHKEEIKQRNLLTADKRKGQPKIQYQKRRERLIESGAIIPRVKMTDEQIYENRKHLLQIQRYMRTWKKLPTDRITRYKKGKLSRLAEYRWVGDSCKCRTAIETHDTKENIKVDCRKCAKNLGGTCVGDAGQRPCRCIHTDVKVKYFVCIKHNICDDCEKIKFEKGMFTHLKRCECNERAVENAQNSA